MQEFVFWYAHKDYICICMGDIGVAGEAHHTRSLHKCGVSGISEAKNDNTNVRINATIGIR